MRISDWSSDVCSSDLRMGGVAGNSALPLATTDGAVESDELGGDMRPTPWLQQCPCIMQVMDALGATWGRSRLMRLSGRSQLDRKSVVSGKSVSVRVDLGCRRIIKQKKQQKR